MKKGNIFIIVLVVVTLFSARYVSAEVNIITPEIYERIMDSIDVSNADLKKYKNIFKALDNGDFNTADNLVEKLDNQYLLGYVLAEKYLHPSYKTSIEELEDWLEDYRDYPQATRIYNLAKKKGAKDIKEVVYHSDDSVAEARDDKISLKYLERLSPSDRKFLVRQAKIFRAQLRRGKTLAARGVLENKRFKRLAPRMYWDNLAAKLSMKYLVDNYDTKALEWGKIASKRHNSGTATWVAGLASWRKKNYKSAASYFARLGSSQNSDVWLKSAGAFWSARAYDKLGNHLKAREMLKLAAQHKYTFYGILAAYQLGENFDYGFDKNSYINDFEKMDYVNEIITSKQIVRALLLLKIGKNEWAEKELYSVYDDLSDNQKEAVILLANQYELHSLVINISKQKNIEALQGSYEKEMYPLPKWSDEQKWEVDKALILALIRQESAFKDNATSKAGARGIMQLMPNTAYHISGDKSVKKQKNKLLNLDYNLSLGQKYVSYLLSKPFIEGNLFYMLTAYNGGPGNLLKWKKNARFYNDPLLFIEVIPSAETRIYIERVMANHWIYNMRFGNKNHTLEQLAEGKWPTISVVPANPIFDKE
ncbi:MAG: lytic transglycosylase domain-containing protein [Alphaproteobacteria bacterium]|nr:lytic transglycosylase domain-containing protein [Alphaproteobacteria bacterium]